MKIRKYKAFPNTKITSSFVNFADSAIADGEKSDFPKDGFYFSELSDILKYETEISPSSEGVIDVNGSPKAQVSTSGKACADFMSRHSAAVRNIKRTR